MDYKIHNEPRGKKRESTLADECARTNFFLDTRGLIRIYKVIYFLFIFFD